MNSSPLPPLGVYLEHRDGVFGYHFAVRSPLATQVVLCLFADDGNEQRIDMQKTDDIWHTWVAHVSLGQCYGYRADGESTEHQPFNPQKVLLDPYAKGVVGKPELSNHENYQRFLLSDTRDNADIAPKSVIIDEVFDWGDDEFPQTPWSETIIYELHVKGFTKLHPEIPQELRGSYAGLASPVIIQYLKSLGVTAIELLPIAYGIDEPHLQNRQLTNYWNYNVLSPFSIESDYWSGRDNTTPLSEFKSAVKALHSADIEVILDVVFNHTAEAEHHHPSYCYRGLANRDFYWLNDDGSCVNHTGCGNMINASHPATQQWIIDCLCYWVDTCHVDGFRFDLASVLGREPDFNTYASLFQRVANEPILQGIKLIAEPWDIGPNGYQLGHFPSHFSEWNDRFRDDMRTFFLHQSGRLNAFSERLAGSSDIFKHNKRLPYSTINLITAHDGFTLADLVAYNDKHNHDNGEDNRDGDSNNHSYNHGIEGVTGDDNIIKLRKNSQRALLSALLLSNGTPMILAGDEIGHSQGGNNNAYCQDNEVTWLDWAQADNDLLHFTQNLIHARKRIASLMDGDWWSDDNIVWQTPDAKMMQISDWESRDLKAMQIQLNNDYLLLINGKHDEQHCILPTGNWYDAHNNAVNDTLKALTVLKLSITLLTK